MKPRNGSDTVDALTIYLRGLKDCNPLTREEEVELATRFHAHGDQDAAHRLARANLRAVVKIASRYRRPGIGLLELIQEGNLGLLQAVKRFNPERGVRLVTYASWWIRAYIQRYLQERYHHLNRQTLSDSASLLGDGVEEYHTGRGFRQVREISLDQPVGSDEYGAPLSAMLADDSPDQEDLLLEREDHRLRQAWVLEGLHGLDSQERIVIRQRYLSENPHTLKEIGEELGLSRQRIHQIEQKARRKLGVVLATQHQQHAQL